MAQRQTTCNLYTSTWRNGLKFFAYTYVPFLGLYAEDGEILRGSEGQAITRQTVIPAKATPAPKVCCGQLGAP